MTTHSITCLGCGLVTAILLPAASASGTSNLATFKVSGPATNGASGMWGDAMLESVEFPSGEVFTDFVTAKRILDFDCPSSYSGLGWSVSTGTDCTTAVPGWFKVQAEDGNSSNISDEDRELFNQRILDTLNDRNLNSLVHLKSSGASFIIEFNELLYDNDADLDSFGEVLYFERGAGAGNSTVHLQAVDENGNGLGPVVTIDGAQTEPTTPLVTIGTAWAPSLTNQTMGCTTIDLTRLGVSELQYLRVSNGASDPDLKVFAVWTQPRLPDHRAFFD